MRKIEFVIGTLVETKRTIMMVLVNQPAKMTETTTTVATKTHYDSKV
jgi:hypothetical protein